MVGMCEHGENVGNLVRPATPDPAKPPRRDSRAYRAVREEAAEAGGRRRHQHRTMGEAPGEAAADPEAFLRKQAGEVRFRQRAKSARAHREF